MIADERDPERDECDRCEAPLYGQWTTNYGERLCDSCYDGVTVEPTTPTGRPT